MAAKQPIMGHIKVTPFFTLTSLFYFGCQRCNTESWLLTKQVTASSKVHTLCTWGHKILLLQAFESVQTSHQNYMELKELLPRWMLWLSLRKTPLFAIILLFFFRYLSLNINPFFNWIVVLFLFSCHMSCYDKPYLSLHCRCWFHPILNG